MFWIAFVNWVKFMFFVSVILGIYAVAFKITELIGILPVK